MPGQAGRVERGMRGSPTWVGDGTTLVPTARLRNRNERLSQFNRIAECNRADGISYLLSSLHRGRDAWARRQRRVRQTVRWWMTVWMGEMCLYRLLRHDAVTLLELLSEGWLISPEDGPGMTLVGHAAGAGRVVALLLRSSADPLSNGGGRGGRASRSARPRCCGA
jgi:hypothetical protein